MNDTPLQGMVLSDAFDKMGLSDREIEVASLVNKGFRNKEVADALFVTEKTVKFHLTNIYKKLKVRSRAQLIVWAMPYVRFQEANKAPEPPMPAMIEPPAGWGEDTMPVGFTKVGNA
jgi:DNA-binding CsgD family transcriptional regulator